MNEISDLYPDTLIKNPKYSAITGYLLLDVLQGDAPAEGKGHQSGT